ncbi:sensor histidine kinase [Peptostreptococcus faecalis]|uniref:sensor histidine kinase n=1 Tax=Peptostreptococcus faecalis TaxID=2045015 RepID=UPI0011AF1534|nr:sensor histidine kinase [Peptostreptococcus faecalis]
MTKRKIENKNKQRNIFSGIIFAIMLILALSMIYRYHFVELRLEEEKTNPFETKAYTSDIFYSNYYLYYKNYQSKSDKIIKPADLFLSDETINAMITDVNVDYYSSKLDNESVRRTFNEKFNELSEFIVNSGGNLKYYSKNTKTGVVTKNYNFEEYLKVIQDYKNNNYTDKDEAYKKVEEVKKEINNKFMNFMVVKYDSKGTYSLLYTSGLNYDVINNYFMELESSKNIQEMYSMNDEVGTDFSSYKAESIKDTVYVYAVPKGIKPDFYDSTDTISAYLIKPEKDSFRAITRLSDIISHVILVITLLIPASRLKMLRGIKFVYRFPTEVLMGIFLILRYELFNDVTSIVMVKETVTGNLLKAVLSYNINFGLAKQVINLFNISYWVAFFSMITVFAAILKLALKEGLFTYLSRQSLTVGFVKLIFSKIKKIFLSIIATDFTRRYNRMCFIGIVIVVSGFVLITIPREYNLEVWWLFVVVFFIVLASFIKMVINELKEVNKDYDKLLELTKDIADGNLDKNIINEDVGIYEEIKRQLASIQVAYKKSVEEEVKSQRMKAELISNVSHDLKTPLTSIISYVDLLKDTEVSDEAKTYIDTIYRKSERLKILIDDMFEITKTQTGDIKVEYSDVDIVELMKQSIFELSDRLENSKVILRTKFPDEKIILRLDGEKTYRIFENLIVNMAKYSMPNTRAYIEIKEIGEDDVEISFKNISATEIDYKVEDILDRFKRGDKSRNTEGSGLGISIAKGYVNVQGGSINFELEGDLFKVTIIFKKTKYDLAVIDKKSKLEKLI